MDVSAFDPTELTATAALIIFGYLVFRFMAGRVEKKDALVEKKDAFAESIMIKMMEKSDAADARAQRTTDNFAETMQEYTRALKEGDDATIERLNNIEKGQIRHESKAQERHRELVRK